MAAESSLRSREVSTMIKQGFIPDQSTCFSPSKSTSNPSRSQPYSPSTSPPNSSPVATPYYQSLIRPTLFEMMSQEQYHQDSSAELRTKVSRILSNAPFHNSITDASVTNRPGGDVRLTVVSRYGFRISMDVHRQVLSEKSRYFSERLKLEKGSHSVEVEISECDDVEVYLETVVLMYSDDLKRKLTGQNVSKVLGLLKVSSAVMFDEGISACLEYLEAVPWSNEEEEKVISLLHQLHLLDSATELLQRVSARPSTSAKPDDILMRLLSGILQAKDEKARREMKALVSRLLKEDSSSQRRGSSCIDVSRDTLYHICHRCLSSLILCLSEATGMDDSSGRDRGSLMGEIAREADNLNWIVGILINWKMGDEFVKLWGDQKELAILHSKIPTMYRHEVSQITAQLCVAIGRGNLLIPWEIRLSLLLTWLEGLYEDFGWMKRASRSMDRKLVEEGLGQTILTLPMSHQQAIMLDWIDRYLNKGDDCPNIQRAFEIWWKRAFVKQNAAPLLIATSTSVRRTPLFGDSLIFFPAQPPRPASPLSQKSGMKTVSGEIISARPVSLSKASKVLLRFVTVDNGTSPPISIFLRKASEAFHELVQFHKGVKTPSFVDYADNSGREIETEGERSDQRKHKHGEKKRYEGHGGDSGLVEANGDSMSIASRQLANGDGKPTDAGIEKRKRKHKDEKFKGGDGNGNNDFMENGRGNVNSNREVDVKWKMEENKEDDSVGIREDGAVKEGEVNVNVNGWEDAGGKKKEKKKRGVRMDVGEDGAVKEGMKYSDYVNSNRSEDADGENKKQKRKEKKGDASVGTGEDGAVEGERDKGRKRKMEMSEDGMGKDDDSIEGLSKKKKKKSGWSRV
ncbi:hypothetical protein SAY87_015592 [Trapa incisa]|uniref:BTB domain-containing protein n=1 Tax=Trapa incisa TaxID=236973 RepID=A0AAN7L5G3_9MYRT|nr:hypothetical protein SAY87_015592 [Trapa incisa]